MRQADVEVNPGKRLNAYNQAEQLLVTNVAWFPLDQGRNSRAKYHQTSHPFTYAR